MRPTPLSLLSALLCLAAALPPRSSATPVPTGGFEMRCENGRITVTSNEAPVEQLLSEFSRKSGVTFNKFAGKSATATLDLRDAAYEEFLSRLLGSYMAKSRKIDGQMVVSEVTVMDEGTGSAPPPGFRRRSVGRAGAPGGDAGAGGGAAAPQAETAQAAAPPRTGRGGARRAAGEPAAPLDAPPDQPPDAEPPRRRRRPTRSRRPRGTLPDGLTGDAAGIPAGHRVQSGYRV